MRDEMLRLESIGLRLDGAHVTAENETFSNVAGQKTEIAAGQDEHGLSFHLQHGGCGPRMADSVEILHVSVATHRQPSLLDLPPADRHVRRVEHQMPAAAIEVVTFPEDRRVDHARCPLSERTDDEVPASLA